MISDSNGGLPRYCTPFHGGWDVARIALNIPESRILFVCPASCARIICLNAVKYGYKDRISVLGLTEADIVSGDYDEKTIEAAEEYLSSLDTLPRVLILYVSCIDSMLGNDHNYQISEIKKRFKGVECFVLHMCPICRDSGDLPLVRLSHDIFASMPTERIEKTNKVGFIGSNLPLSEDNELIKLLRDGGYEPVHLNTLKSYDDFLAMRGNALNLCLMPFGKSACALMKERYGIDYVPYFNSFDPDKTKATLRAVCEKLSLPLPDLDSLQSDALGRLKNAAGLLDGREVAIDSTVSLDIEALRTLLTSCGFNIGVVYVDSAEGDHTDSGSIYMPSKRKFEKSRKFAIGPLAGCFECSDSTVDIFYDNGLWGFDGIAKLAGLIEKEARREKSL